VIHLVAGLIIANMNWQTVKWDRFQIIQAQYENDEIEPLPVEEPEVREVKKVEEIEEVTADPTVTDEVIYEEFAEDDQQPIDAPFEGKNVNDVIGGGAVGKFGGKYRRRSAAKKGGQATQKAVDWGLDWLKRHQDPEGFWDSDGFHMLCTDNTCTGRGDALNDPGITGLVLLAFLGAGNTPVSGEYKDEVKKGVRYLCDIQDPEDGCLTSKESPHYMYNHALACLALTEAYGLSRWMPLKKHARKAIEFIHASRNPGKAWRYNLGTEIDPIEQNDVSVTGWMIMCLASAKDFGLPFDKGDIEDALLYLDEMTDSATGRTGYKERGSYSSREVGDETLWPYEKVEAMTAVGMLGRVFCGNILGNLDTQKEMLEKGAKLLKAKPPLWDEESGTIDYYYWYYGSYAMFQMAGNDWRFWKDHMIKAIVEHQCTEGCARGSWDPKYGPWGDNGGRVYSCALCTLCLEVFYRYDNVLGAR